MTSFQGNIFRQINVIYEPGADGIPPLPPPPQGKLQAAAFAFPDFLGGFRKLPLLIKFSKFDSPDTVFVGFWYWHLLIRFLKFTSPDLVLVGFWYWHLLIRFLKFDFLVGFRSNGHHNFLRNFASPDKLFSRILKQQRSQFLRNCPNTCDPVGERFPLVCLLLDFCIRLHEWICLPTRFLFCLSVCCCLTYELNDSDCSCLFVC